MTTLTDHKTKRIQMIFNLKFIYGKNC